MNKCIEQSPLNQSPEFCHLESTPNYTNGDHPPDCHKNTSDCDQGQVNTLLINRGVISEFNVHLLN